MKKIKQEILIYGLRRTGNHAITNWILGQLNGKVIYLNDVWPNDPYKGLESKDTFDNGVLDFSVVSFEDYNLQILKKIRPKNSIRIDNSMKILILRDPFNLYASRLKSGMKTPAHFCGLNLRQLYLQYSREFAFKTKILGKDKIIISYNQWKISKSYRKSISKKLGLEFNDRGLNLVTGQGGGSSFDGMSKKGQNLKTELRYKLFLSNPSFINWFKNSDILDFSRRHFFLPSEINQFKSQKFHIKYYDLFFLKFSSFFVFYLRELFLLYKRIK